MTIIVPGDAANEGDSAVVPVLLITGPVGVGKTSVASEVSERLDEAGVPHALVDVDSLRWCYPRPPVDRFRVGLAMRNLAAIWPNFRAAGATRLLLVDVLESRDELARYRAPHDRVCTADAFVASLASAAQVALFALSTSITLGTRMTAISPTRRGLGPLKGAPQSTRAQE